MVDWCIPENKQKGMKPFFIDKMYYKFAHRLSSAMVWIDIWVEISPQNGTNYDFDWVLCKM